MKLIGFFFWREHSVGETEENHEIISQDSRCPGRDSSLKLPECKSKALSVVRSRQIVLARRELTNDFFMCHGGHKIK
jgi:hypothetical protein